MAQGQDRQTHAELERFRTAMDMCGDAIYLVDRKSMRFVDVNQTACTRMGYSRDELLQMGPQNLLAASREAIERLYDEVIAAGASGTTSESTARTKDGRESTTELHRRAMRTDEGWIIVSIARDITRRKLMEQALREGAEKLRLFTDNVPAMTASWDEKLRCSFANRRFLEFFASTARDILGKHVREVLGEEVYGQVEGHFAQALQGHPVTFQRTRKLQNGEAVHIEIKLLPHVGDQGKVLGCFAVATDITEHKLTEERIQRVAHHDSLTGLPNRLLFNDRLFQAISLAKRESRQIALLYLDLDKFKPVNDALGHTAGDELLKAVAARMRRQVRESDTVARVGGDEFTVILPGITRREQAETVARKIIAALAAPFELDSQQQSVDIGTSIGIALYPADAADADALVKAADAAMYIAKQAGNSFRSCAAPGQLKD
jgi:diguanylate cyclase (GGDEF)-like protein/PAS domain S-box-containing protein